MNQVVLKAQADGNNWDYWAEEADTNIATTPDVAKNFTEQYILPYMIYYKYEIHGNYAYIYLNDGSYFYTSKGACIDLVFDTNGEKKPNKKGRDIFRFLYCPEHNGSWIGTSKLIPYLNKGETREQALKNCKTTNGHTCSGLLELDGWQFKDDYPYHI